MRLECMFADKKKTTPHPFYVKSSWQPPVQNSVALEKCLVETKLELDLVVSRHQNDNISANERKAIFSLKRNSEINLKKLTKERNSHYGHGTKNRRRLKELSDDNFYKPRAANRYRSVDFATFEFITC